MGKINSVSYEQACQSIEYSIWDLAFSRSLHNLVMASFMLNKNIKNTYPNSLRYLTWALDNSYVVTLHKVFDNRGECLTKVINQINNLNDEAKHKINSKAHSIFVVKTKKYLKEIRSIEKKLNPLRNKFRVHNFPDRKGPDNVNWERALKWEQFAGMIYDEISEVLSTEARMKHLYDKEQGVELKNFIRKFGYKRGLK